MSNSDLESIAQAFREAADAYKKESEEYWDSLSKDDQLKVFCAVTRRICKGELDDEGTYRWVLYDVFGFGPEAYVPAQMAGYLELHNSIYKDHPKIETLRHFCEVYNIEDAEERIKKFLF